MYNIHFWHGPSIGVAEMLLDIKGVTVQDDVYWYDGTLDYFEQNYPRNFMIIRNNDGPTIIAVTQFSNFGQR